MKTEKKHILTRSCAAFGAFCIGILVSVSLVAQDAVDNNESSCVLVTGLAGWWPAEAGGLDEWGSNDGTMFAGTSLAAGKIGTAFKFSGGTTGGVMIDSPHQLDVGKGDGFSVECWFYADAGAANFVGAGPIFEWKNGVHVWQTHSNPDRQKGLLINMVRSSGQQHVIQLADVIEQRMWNHLVVTYSKLTGRASIYVNGELGSSTAVGVFTPKTDSSFSIGLRPEGSFSSNPVVFSGIIDEATVYARELSADDVNRLASATVPKCPPVTITFDPDGGTFTDQASVALAVNASDVEIRYTLDGSEPEASSSVYEGPLPILQSTVILARAFRGGAAVSKTYSVEFNHVSGVCYWARDMVAWWPAENSAKDVVGDHTGSLEAGVTFGPGLVGTGFQFRGDGAVVVNHSQELALSNFTLEGWVFPTMIDGEFDVIASKEYPLQFIMGIKGSVNRSVPSGGAIPQGNLAFSIGNVSGFPDDYAGWVDGGGRIPIGKWTHVALTFDGQTAVTYINGVRARSFTNLTGTVAASTAPLRIGSRSPAVTRLLPKEGFNGGIDEVSLHSVALSSAAIREIRDAYHLGKCPPPSILIEPNGGDFEGSVDVTLRPVSAEPGDLIRYTIDGAEVTADSTLYLSPIRLEQTARVRAQVFRGTEAVSKSVVARFTRSDVPPLCAKPLGLVGWWPLDGNGAELIGRRDGRVEGGNTIPGVVQDAVSFNGSAFVVITNSPLFHLQNFTIEAWVKRSETNRVSTSTTANLFGFGSGGFVLGLFSDGRLFLSKSDVSHVAGTARIQDTNWHHVAVTRSGTNVVFYLDGQAEARVYGDAFTFSTDLAIGGRADLSSGRFIGAIDEVSLYNRALVEDDIVDLVFASSTGKCLEYPPTLTVVPSSASVVAGNSATFSAAAIGRGPLTWEWRHNSQVIEGVEGSTLVLADVQPSHAGAYTVRVRNAHGSMTSPSAELSVVMPPRIVQQPAPLAIRVGETLRLEVFAEGSSPLVYQWFFNNTPVGSSSLPELTFSEASTSMAGTYYVRVSNSIGSVESDRVIVEVLPNAPALGAKISGEGVAIVLSGGDSGQSYAIEYTSDFVNWTELPTHVAGPEPVTIIHTRSGGQRFYRAKSVQQ